MSNCNFVTVAFSDKLPPAVALWQIAAAYAHARSLDVPCFIDYETTQVGRWLNGLVNLPQLTEPMPKIVWRGYDGAIRIPTDAGVGAIAGEACSPTFFADYIDEVQQLFNPMIESVKNDQSADTVYFLLNSLPDNSVRYMGTPIGYLQAATAAMEKEYIIPTTYKDTNNKRVPVIALCTTVAATAYKMMYDIYKGTSFISVPNFVSDKYEHINPFRFIAIASLADRIIMSPSDEAWWAAFLSSGDTKLYCPNKWRRDSKSDHRTLYWEGKMNVTMIDINQPGSIECRQLKSNRVQLRHAIQRDSNIDPAAPSDTDTIPERKAKLLLKEFIPNVKDRIDLNHKDTREARKNKILTIKGDYNLQ